MSITTDIGPNARRAATDKQNTLASASSKPVVTMAWIGLALVLFEGYTWLSWIFGPNFKPTDPGPDPISPATLTAYAWLQGAVVLLGLTCIWFWIIRPTIRNRGMTTDVMIAIACWTSWFYDCSMNYLMPTVIYNSHMVNFGAWTMGSWPSWVSPNGHLLPEPVLITGTSYLSMVFSQVLVVCWLLRKAKERWPNLGPLSICGLIVLGATITDTLIEAPLLHTGIYAYPYGIRELTLSAGETYQFPLTEGFTFGGMTVGAIAMMRFFKNDKGQVWAERGIEMLRIGKAANQAVRFLAIFGFVHLSFVILFMIPNQWLALQSDPWPTGYPSYMINNMCVYGVQHNECPGPGVMMPRP